MIKNNRFYILIAASLFSSSVLAGNWYEGGNLHKSNISTWKASTYENKLATAADWVFMSPSAKTLVQNSGNINTAKKFAKELVSCIDTATDGMKLTDGTTDIAASCMVLMGWLK